MESQDVFHNVPLLKTEEKIQLANVRWFCDFALVCNTNH